MIASSFITALGSAAGTLTTLSFLPQVVHTWKQKSAKEISYGMLLAFSTGVALWLLYGLYLRAWPLIVANGVTLILTLLILILKIRYR